jgi:hypothetical protein
MTSSTTTTHIQNVLLHLHSNNGYANTAFIPSIVLVDLHTSFKLDKDEMKELFEHHILNEIR